MLAITTQYFSTDPNSTRSKTLKGKGLEPSSHDMLWDGSLKIFFPPSKLGRWPLDPWSIMIWEAARRIKKIHNFTTWQQLQHVNSIIFHHHDFLSARRFSNDSSLRQRTGDEPQKVSPMHQKRLGHLWVGLVWPSKMYKDFVFPPSALLR